jgi:hypothetical protein
LRAPSASEGFPLTGRPGYPRTQARMLTERKLAEFALAERNLQLALAGNVGRVGSYASDVSAEKLQVSEGYAALHGLPEGITETTLSEWRARVHSEDLGRAEGGIRANFNVFAVARFACPPHFDGIQLEHVNFRSGDAAG